MDTSPNLILPYIVAAQAQKHVTHNEAIRALDVLVQISVLDRNLTQPPAAPTEGARYLIAPQSTGGWTGRSGNLAAFQDGAWAYYAPKEGWVIWIGDENKLVVFDGLSWTEVGASGTGSVNPVPLVGINTTADATNRLAIASPASLFNHQGAGHQLKINKSAATDTNSLIFQTGFSGRAEFGTTGDDDFHVKVSADGATWREAIVVNKATGVVSLPLTPASTGAGSATNLLINGDFQINQRNFAGGALAANAYGFDRWKAEVASSVTLAGYTLTLASGRLVQVIEPAAWGHANLASTPITVATDDPSADLTVSIGSVSGIIQAGPGRRTLTLTTVATDTGNLAIKISKATAGSVSFSRVSAEIGTVPTGWTARARQAEEQLANRYYWAVANLSLVQIDAYVGAGGYFFSYVVLPVKMRATPAVGFTVTSASNILNNEVGMNAFNPTMFRYFARGNAQGRIYAEFNNIAFNAEL